MTLILFVGIPLLILLFIKTTPSNKGIYNVSQLAVTVAIIAVGAYASYRFSDHISVHAIIGLVIICLLLPIWSLLQLIPQLIPSVKTLGLTAEKLRSIQQWISIVLLFLIFPTQWMLGMREVVTFSWTGSSRWGYFIGHYGPAMFFMLPSGVLVWKHTNMDMIMKGEFSVMMVAGALEVIGETIRDRSASNPHFWHHIILAGAALMMGLLCLMFYKLKVFPIEK